MVENRSDEQPAEDWDAATQAPAEADAAADAHATVHEKHADAHAPHRDLSDPEPEPAVTQEPSVTQESTLASEAAADPGEATDARTALRRDEPAADAWAPGGLASTDPAVAAEHDRLVAERAARRQQRVAALAPKPEPIVEPTPVAPVAGAAKGTAPRVVAAAPAPAAPVTVVQRTNDKFFGSLGLFLLRLIVAAIMGVHGANKLMNLPAAVEMLQSTILPSPNILAIVIGSAEVAIAIALVFGLLTRVAGLGVALVAGGALAFVQWGNWSPFKPGEAGFTGELELLLVGVGLLFLLVGGGGWSVDRGFRSRKTAD